MTIDRPLEWRNFRRTHQEFNIPPLRNGNERRIFYDLFFRTRSALEKKDKVFFKFSELPWTKKDCVSLLRKNIVVIDDEFICLHPSTCTLEISCPRCQAKFTEGVFWRIGYYCPACSYPFAPAPLTITDLSLPESVMNTISIVNNKLNNSFGFKTDNFVIVGLPPDVPIARSELPAPDLPALPSFLPAKNNPSPIQLSRADFLNFKAYQQRKIYDYYVSVAAKKQAEILDAQPEEVRSLISEYLSIDCVTRDKKIYRLFSCGLWMHDGLSKIRSDPRLGMLAPGLASQLLLRIKTVADELFKIPEIHFITLPK